MRSTIGEWIGTIFVVAILLIGLVAAILGSGEGTEHKVAVQFPEPFFVNESGQHFISLSDRYSLEAWVKDHPKARVVSIAKNGRGNFLVVYEETGTDE